jgi:ParB family chromosome partitioning protein
MNTFRSGAMNVVSVPCEQIRPDPQSPGYTPQAVEELAASIRENGLLRPILVRETEDGYVIVHGERRWRAVQMLGHASILAWTVLDYLHRSGGTL